jgi:hypothetical protein
MSKYVPEQHYLAGPSSNWGSIIDPKTKDDQIPTFDIPESSKSKVIKAADLDSSELEEIYAEEVELPNLRKTQPDPQESSSDQNANEISVLEDEIEEQGTDETFDRQMQNFRTHLDRLRKNHEHLTTLKAKVQAIENEMALAQPQLRDRLDAKLGRNREALEKLKDKCLELKFRSMDHLRRAVSKGNNQQKEMAKNLRKSLDQYNTNNVDFTRLFQAIQLEQRKVPAMKRTSLLRAPTSYKSQVSGLPQLQQSTTTQGVQVPRPQVDRPLSRLNPPKTYQSQSLASTAAPPTSVKLTSRLNDAKAVNVSMMAAPKPTLNLNDRPKSAGASKLQRPKFMKKLLSSIQQPSLQRPATSPQQPTTPPRQPSTPPRHPITPPQQPATSPQQHSSSQQQPSTSRQQPTSPQQPSTSRQQPATSPQQHSSSQQQPSTSRQQPTSPQQPSTSRQQPAAPPQQTETQEQRQARIFAGETSIF